MVILFSKYEGKLLMPASKTKDYNDFELCKDVALAELTRAQIAAKHGLSESMVNQVARGDSRPELKPIIDEIIEAERSAAIRLARSRARWFVARLIQLASRDSDIGLKAVIKGLEIAGLDQGSNEADKKQAIEIILSAQPGKGDPLKRRLTGVYNPNSDN